MTAALSERWNQALHFLKHSRLRKLGRPVDVLPWVLLVGPRGAGKSSALRHAQLDLFGDPFARGAPAPTTDCDWWFAEEAIFIDTAGDAAAGEGEEADMRAWKELLEQLLRARRREPVNGLVITLAAAQLTAEPAEMLERIGKEHRGRIDALTQAMGAKVPVYVLVTQIDRLPGAARWLQGLSPDGLRQAAGGLNREMSANAADFIDKTFASVGERLKVLRLLLAAQPESAHEDLLSFPDEIARLKTGLAAFARGAFQESLYQETPLLRGLYFSGGQAFLHDFFTRILPRDRGLFIPTRQALEWKKQTLSVGLGGWLAVSAVAGGLMSYSFVKNLAMLREADRDFSSLPALHEDLVGNILALDRFNQAILRLDQRLSQARFMDFGLHEADRVRQSLEQRLSADFRQAVLPVVDAQYAQSMSGLNARSSDVAFSEYVGHLVSRLKLLHEKVEAGRSSGLPAGAPPLVPFLRVAGSEADRETKDKVARLYVSSLYWLADQPSAEKEMSALQGWLRRLLVLKARTPQWIIAWANAQDAVAPITLKDFWGGEPAPGGASVPAIFSKRDKGRVDSFLAEIERALADPETFAALRRQFDRWYRVSAFEAWRKFLIAFPAGAQRLGNKAQWRQVAASMPKDEGPYFALLDQVAEELEPLASDDMPLWLNHIYQFRNLKRPHARISQLAQRYIGGASGHAQEEARQALQAYLASLQKAADTAADGAQAAQAAAQAFRDDSATESSVFGAADLALARFQSAAGMDASRDPIVAGLLAGPFNYLWEYARLQTAEHLQAEWESKVLAEASGAGGHEAVSVVLAQDGPAMRFAREAAGPYIQWSPGRNFYRKEALGGMIPFSGRFLSFLNQGNKASTLSRLGNVNVTVTALAPETNAGTRRFPHSTRLELECGGAKQVLTNRRQRVIEKVFDPAEKSFAWSSACSDAVLEIDVGDSRLIKRYPGAYGFFNFLQEFKDGTHVFYTRDFPEEASALSAMGIHFIDMRYRIKGLPDFNAPVSVPSQIVQGGWYVNAR